MKLRKILKLTQLKIQKGLIQDVKRAMETSEDISEYQKDLKRRKIKFIDTINQYYSKGDWKWIVNKTKVEIEKPSSFNPVYQESKKMKRLNTTENISDSPSLNKTVHNFVEDNNYILSSRSQSPNPFQRANTVNTNPEISFGSSTVGQIRPQQRRKVDIYRTSAENPMADTLSQYYGVKQPQTNKNIYGENSFNKTMNNF